MTIPKKVTMDSLAGMIKRGFDDVDKRFVALESRFTDRIDGLEKRVDDLDKKIDTKIDELDKKVDFRFNGLQNRMDAMALYYTPLRAHDELRDRVKRVERAVRR